MKIDFYKEFKLAPPVAGLVEKITSPKGIRIQEKDGYSYKLHTDLCYLYQEGPQELDPGVYLVLDVCKINSRMRWNHYLFIIEGDDSVHPIAEFVDCNGDEWIPDAVPIIKRAFLSKYKPIKITPYIPPVVIKSSWTRC